MSFALVPTSCQVEVFVPCSDYVIAFFELRLCLTLFGDFLENSGQHCYAR